MDRAVRVGDGETVVAHFAEVEQLEGVDAADFSIRAGPDGTFAPCIEAEAGRTTIRLRWDKPIPGAAHLRYGGRAYPGSSLRDETGNRAPSVVLPIDDGEPPADQSTKAPNGAGVDIEKHE